MLSEVLAPNLAEIRDSTGEKNSKLSRFGFRPEFLEHASVQGTKEVYGRGRMLLKPRAAKSGGLRLK